MGRNRRTVFEPRQVKGIAEKYSYTEIPLKPQVSGYMLSFEHPSKRGCGGTDSEAGHVRIDVYFTTGKVTTSLNHHKAGKGQMIRENVDLAMVERIFSYHSNTGYKEKQETRDKRRMVGLNQRDIVRLAREMRCEELAVSPQERRKLAVFSHPQADLLRVWFTTGTVQIVLSKTDRRSGVYLKNFNLQQLREIFRDPVGFVSGKTGTSSAPKENIVYRIGEDEKKML